MRCVTLADRTLVRIAGDDAQHFLQDVVSCGVEDLPHGEARPGALLSPQGKILFAFLISREGDDGFVFELDRGAVQPFMQRMTMYRLRVKADIEELTDRPVQAVWDSAHQEGWLRDRRFQGSQAAFRAYGQGLAETASLSDYDLLRIENGVCEDGSDYLLGDAFPHDVLMDLNEGVSFSKGCFVGQEVVSRMQHRGTARRRIAIVEASSPLPETGAPLTVNGRAVGSLGTVHARTGLALVRTDKVAAALADKAPVLADDTEVSVRLPEWTGLSLQPADSAKNGD
ncbi:YgfZ/GcvT domain-containing protein [Hoeflea prorocentri]|uniref:Folate-binding protein n=1 Tax=Hoeflea prorocentri TaxID=1922333 RepID=A0A9X3ZH47_9HYPH|nr:folate-binding protein [Hoeflea prorocentri]MCY6381447.1 folate-binding protein [Hoeflea prorocentri]MDA5399247.1 folate-binding protein [Hoeflea prorocentri]